MIKGSIPFAIVVAAQLLAADASRPPAEPSYPCIKTLADLRSLSMAISEYAIDNGKFPDVASIEELRPLVAPMYIANLQTRDAWGTEFVYRLSADGKSFRVASAGSDRRFDEATWNSPGLLGSSADDAVLESGRVWRVVR